MIIRFYSQSKFELPKFKTRNVLIVLNPFSGNGAARAKWQEVKPMFDAVSSYLRYELVETKGPGHAQQLASELDCAKWDSLVFVSGDGLMHEILNGLMARSDYAEVKKKIVLGGIPGGTGNGLIKSILTEAGEEYGAKEAAYLVIRDKPGSIDITKIILERMPQKPVYSFLSVSYSALADIDLNSDHLRWIGPIRYEVRAVWRLLNLMRP